LKHTAVVVNSIFIQIKNKGKDLVVGVIYKPPDIDVAKFNEKIEEILKTLAKEHRPCYLMGDFNINLLRHDKHIPTKHFLETLLAYGFYPLINIPTRLTTESATPIDNIFTNVHDINTKPGVWITDISDHMPVFVMTSHKDVKAKTTITINKYVFNEETLNKFKNSLEIHDWSFLNNLTDILCIINFWIRYRSYMQSHFPVLIKL